MAEVKGTNVAAPVVPFSTDDVHPTHEALYGKGGYRTVATTAARDAIPAARREHGMLVYVSANAVSYQLESDLVTWTVAAGTATWETIVGKPATFAPSAHTHDQSQIGSTLGNTDLAGDIQEVLATALNRSNHTGTQPLSTLSQSGATTSQVVQWNGSAWVPATISTYTLPAATTSTLGGVIVSTGLAVSAGTLTVAYGTTAGTACQGSDARLSDARTPTGTAGGDLTGTFPNPTLAASGATAGTYRSVTVDTKGRVTAGTNPTTLSGYGITDAAAATHAHGNITSDGRVGTLSSRVLVTTTGGSVTSTDKLTQSQVVSTLGGNVLSDDISYLFNNTAPLSHTHTSGDVATVSNGNPLSELDALVDAIITSDYTTALVSVFGGVASSDSRLTNARTPTSHSHGNIGNDGSVGSTANRIAVTTTGGVLTTATIGSGLSLSGGTLTASGGGGGSSVGSDLYLWSVYR